jgi:sarcosine oxidase subunit beta
MQPRTADVVIIGAGAIGCRIAYHLGLRGAKNVVVVEQEFVGSGTTSKAAGGIRVQFPTAVEITFSMQSLEFFERFHQEMGVNPHLQQVGYLFLLGSERDVEQYKQQIALQSQYGLDVQLLTPQDAKAIVPQLRVDDLRAAVYSPRDGYADPHTVVQGYATKARERGVKILEQTEVTGIRLEGDRVVGVDTPSGLIETRLVVNAAGPWAMHVAEMVGATIIDYLPGVEGLLCAVGFCGHGFQHSPAAGRMVAEMILDGQPSHDISALSFARFQETMPLPSKSKVPEPD